MNKKITLTSEYNDLRIDKVLSLLESEFSRSFLSTLFDNNKVLVNGKVAKSSHMKVYENDVIEYEIEEEKNFELKKIDDANLDIIYEDDDVIVINKPAGLVVHPAPGHTEDTLVNMLIGKVDNLSDINGDLRPGIVHRIDKDTSGLLLVAKNNKAHVFLSDLLKDHDIKREYYALVEGNIYEDDGKIVAPIGRDKKYRQKMAVDTRNGKDAITYFHVEERFNNKTLVSCKLETGRTHQIRVHMAYIGHPVVGDPLYNNKKYNGIDGQMLHAYKLTFPQPTTKKEVTVECPLPQNFVLILEQFK